LNGTPETRDATNRLRFVYFSINRRRGYVSFPIGFLHEENDFTQYLKIYLDIFRHIRKFLDLRKTILFCVNIRWVLSPPTTSRCTLEREDNLKNVIYNYYPYYTTQLLCNRFTFTNITSSLQNKVEADKKTESFTYT